MNNMDKTLIKKVLIVLGVIAAAGCLCVSIWNLISAFNKKDNLDAKGEPYITEDDMSTDKSTEDTTVDESNITDEGNAYPEFNENEKIFLHIENSHGFYLGMTKKAFLDEADKGGWKVEVVKEQILEESNPRDLSNTEEIVLSKNSKRGFFASFVKKSNGAVIVKGFKYCSDIHPNAVLGNGIKFGVDPLEMEKHYKVLEKEEDNIFMSKYIYEVAPNIRFTVTDFTSIGVINHEIERVIEE